MFEESITLNEFNRGYLSRLLADIADDQLDWQPHSGLHSVRWLLAHLAIAADYGFAQLGMPFLCPADWHQAYGPTSQAGTSATIRPSREELVSMIERAYSQLCSAAREATPEAMAVPHAVALLQSTNLRTKGDLLAHILVSHFAVHVGQLSSVRRLAGKPMLF